jgi:putative PIN family toxin of toxin-antitoxin system
MVFLQGTARDSGPAAALLRLWEDNAFTLLASGEVLLEIEDVLSRPKIRRVNPRLTERRVRDLMARLRHQALWPEVRSVHVHLSRDPKDEKYLNLAVAGRADYLVSWDKHLMGLRSDDTPEALHFREAYPDIRIVTPVEFLQAISASVR